MYNAIGYDSLLTLISATLHIDMLELSRNSPLNIKLLESQIWEILSDDWLFL